MMLELEFVHPLRSDGTELTVWRAPRADNDEEASPKKERRTHENKRRLRENAQRRANENWRCRELRGSSRNNARISQPGGKKIAI